MISSRLLVFLLIGISIFTDQSVNAQRRKTTDGETVVTEGISKALAIYRKSAVSAINYTLNFDIPANRSMEITASEILTFHLKKNTQALQIDFKESADKIKALKVNDVALPVTLIKEHLVISPKNLKAGNNVIKIDFVAGNGALNRNPEYLYTLFVPDRARTVFPCFDQPDLKATYTLTLSVPTEWNAIANAPLKSTLIKGPKRIYHFEESDVLSTYLFAFAAGKFTIEQELIKDRSSAFLYRETDSLKIAQSVPQIFKIHNDALKYYEAWTGITYPFKKFGFVAIPDFQFGGMEHPGNIQYKSASLFLDEGATKDQRNARSNLIAHETAHMWFGDLVTMNWFTDVWMKEVFANFMADKSMQDSIGKAEYDLKFLVDHFPAAYNVDRTRGSNPIRQDLDNLKDAGSLYGSIIYHKAPIMMRQLERMMGMVSFQTGVREYLKTFANGNASWPELIRILNKYSKTDLIKWNKVWVEEVGRPILDYDMALKDGKISKFSVSQKAEQGPSRMWSQIFELTLVYPDHQEEMVVDLDASKVELKLLKGKEKPLFILFNSSGQGYGLMPVDTSMLHKIQDIQKPLVRASAYISLYENMLNQRYITPESLFKIILEGLSKETEELNLKLMTGYLSTIYWNFTLPAERSKLAENLEGSLWNSMSMQATANNKKILFKAYQDVFTTSYAYRKLHLIWKSEVAPEGIKLTEDDYTSLSFSLALRPEVDAAVLPAQLDRIKNKDRKSRFEFIMPALSPDESVRDAFFDKLALKENRSKESNITTALSYLHHPLRQETSIKYLSKSLDLLSEIQATGDIFFPQSWLQATFGNYQSKQAAAVVADFLKSHPDYNPKLQAKILQTSDNLFRAVDLLEHKESK